MDILGIGVPELVLVVLILLVVAGPRRMVQWAYLIGQQTARLRAMWEEARQLLKDEIKAAGLEDEARELRGLQRDIQKGMNTVKKPIPVPNLKKEVGDFLKPSDSDSGNGAKTEKAEAAAPSSEAQAFKSEAPQSKPESEPEPEPEPEPEQEQEREREQASEPESEPDTTPAVED